MKMNLPQQWLDDLAKFETKGAFKFNALQSVKLTTASEQLNLEELQQKLQQLGKVSGWLQATSEVKTFQHETIAFKSIPLNGELYADGQSISFDYLGDYLWSWHGYQLTTVIAEQATHLAEPIEHQGLDRKKTLYYRRLWRTDEQQAPIADIAIFVGFKE